VLCERKLERTPNGLARFGVARKKKEREDERLNSKRKGVGKRDKREKSRGGGRVKKVQKNRVNYSEKGSQRGLGSIRGNLGTGRVRLSDRLERREECVPR